MSMTVAAWMLCLGAVFGGFGALFGVGGGIIAIPTLVLLFNMDQQVAQGIALVMMLPNVLLGFWKYRKRNTIDLRMAALLAVSAIVSTYFAARMANVISNGTLRDAFGTFLLITAAYLAWRALSGAENQRQRGPLGWASSWIVGAIGGLFSGLFGVGGGTIAPPALTGLFGLSQTAAQGLALAMIAPGMFVALAVYARAGSVDWSLGIAMAIGGLIAVPAGVAAAHKLKGERLKLLFCGFLMLTATMIIAGR